MNFKHKDFIGVFSDVFPDGFCEHLITEFNRNKNLGAGSDRQNSEGSDKHVKNDYFMNCNGVNIDFLPFNNTHTIKMFFEGLQRCFNVYSEEYSPLKNVKVNCNNMKMQKTSTGGGYHIWHAEQGNQDQANRSVVYMLYLNSLPQEANGETEFLYQQRRINPTENTMVLWPAAFTHAHRGNPVYGNNTKYIVTGWFYNE
tara:strand:+ start:3941 stop:4537 length:597 start_codon:yes stop_codon:yes gene_type:complete